MTKPCNFPGRKNRRRKSALERLLVQRTGLASRCSPNAKQDLEQCNRQIATLRARIVDNARSVRTKKCRGPA